MMKRRKKGIADAIFLSFTRNLINKFQFSPVEALKRVKKEIEKVSKLLYSCKYSPSLSTFPYKFIPITEKMKKTKIRRIPMFTRDMRDKIKVDVKICSCLDTFISLKILAIRKTRKILTSKELSLPLSPRVATTMISRREMITMDPSNIFHQLCL